MISAVVLTKNEEKNIQKCLLSLRWCDEVVVIDDLSTDATTEKIHELTERKEVEARNIRIIQNELAEDFAKQRNLGLKETKHEWVLFVDADEEVPVKLADEMMKEIQKNPDIVGWYVKRRDFLFQKELKHGETAKIKLLRLAKKGSGRWRGKVHEIWDIQGRTGELKEELLHHPHPTISDFLKEVNFYSDIVAQSRNREGKKVAAYQIIFYPLGKFISNYFFKLGLLDGSAGFITAMMMSFHSFLVRSKMWQLQNKEQNK